MSGGTRSSSGWPAHRDERACRCPRPAVSYGGILSPRAATRLAAGLSSGQSGPRSSVRLKRLFIGLSRRAPCGWCRDGPGRGRSVTRSTTCATLSVPMGERHGRSSSALPERAHWSRRPPRTVSGGGAPASRPSCSAHARSRAPRCPRWIMSMVMVGDRLTVRDGLGEARDRLVARGHVMGDDADAPAVAGCLRLPLGVGQPSIVLMRSWFACSSCWARVCARSLMGRPPVSGSDLIRQSYPRVIYALFHGVNVGRPHRPRGERRAGRTATSPAPHRPVGDILLQGPGGRVAWSGPNAADIDRRPAPGRKESRETATACPGPSCRAATTSGSSPTSTSRDLRRRGDRAGRDPRRDRRGPAERRRAHDPRASWRRGEDGARLEGTASLDPATGPRAPPLPRRAAPRRVEPPHRLPGHPERPAPRLLSQHLQRTRTDGTHVMAATQFEAIDARRALPVLGRARPARPCSA